MPAPIYVPVVTQTEKGTPAWWTEDAIWKYDHFMCSAGLLGDKNLNTMFPNRRDDVVIIGDSGGFQQASQHKIMSAISVMKWLEANTNVGFILDHPYFEKSGGSGLGKTTAATDDVFEWRLQRTKENVETMMKIRENKGMDFFGVLHGGSAEKMNRWYDELSHFEFDGWGLAAKSGTAKECVDMLVFAKEHDMKKVHILGVSNLRSTAIFSYFADYFEKLTYDSTKWMVFSMYGDFWNPYIKTFDSGMSTRAGNTGEILPVCTCPYCEILSENRTDDKYPRREYINGHNLYWLVQEAKTQYNLLKIDKTAWLKNVVDTVDKSGELRSILKYADSALKIGLEDAGGITHEFW